MFARVSYLKQTNFDYIIGVQIIPYYFINFILLYQYTKLCIEIIFIIFVDFLPTLWQGRNLSPIEMMLCTPYVIQKIVNSLYA